MRSTIAVVLIIWAGVMAHVSSVFAENPSKPMQASSFRVAMVLPGPVNDSSWNTTGYQGLMLIKEKLGATVAYNEKIPEQESERIFRKYANEGYDLIIGHGGQYISAIEKVSDEFPRISFMIVGTYAGNNRNLGAVQFKQEEMGYLAGVVAGLKTKTNKVAYVSGLPLIHMKEKGAYFVLGAKSINPGIEAKSLTINTFTESQAGRHCGEALVKGGFDVLAVDADSAGIPIHQVARDAHIHTIGWATDQYKVAQGTILTSAIQRTELIIQAGAELVRLGRWEGKLYKFGIQEGVQALAPFRGSLTPKEEKQVNKATRDILEGTINLMEIRKPLEPESCSPNQ